MKKCPLKGVLFQTRTAHINIARQRAISIYLNFPFGTCLAIITIPLIQINAPSKIRINWRLDKGIPATFQYNLSGVIPKRERAINPEIRRIAKKLIRTGNQKLLSNRHLNSINKREN